MSNFEEQLFLQHENKMVNPIILPRLKKKYSNEWEKILSDDERLYIWHDSILYLENEKIFDFWKNDFDIEKSLHFNIYDQIHYYSEKEETCIPFILNFENICGIIEHGEKEDRNHYFKPTSLLQTSYVHEIFGKIQEKMINSLNIDYHSITDSGKFQIESKQKLPLNQIVYFRNLIVVFEKVKKVTVRRKKKNKLVARIISGETLLNKNQ